MLGDRDRIVERISRHLRPDLLRHLARGGEADLGESAETHHPLLAAELVAQEPASADPLLTVRREILPHQEAEAVAIRVLAEVEARELLVLELEGLHVPCPVGCPGSQPPI